MGKRKLHKGKLGEHEWSRESKRIVPLQGGYCYISDEKGKLHHLKRDSDEYNSMIEHLESEEVMGSKITKELVELGWR